MAPGILPAAISPLMKSSMRESFLTDTSAPGGGPTPAMAADEGAASKTAATRIASRIATYRQSSGGSFPRPCYDDARDDAAHENAGLEASPALDEAGPPLCSAPPPMQKWPSR